MLQKNGVSCIVQSGSFVLPSPKNQSPGTVTESHSDYIGFAPEHPETGVADGIN
jgi:hypothetical protein